MNPIRTACEEVFGVCFGLFTLFCLFLALLISVGDLVRYVRIKNL